MKSVSIIIPAHNEEKRIGKVVSDTWLEGRAKIVYKGEYDV